MLPQGLAHDIEPARQRCIAEQFFQPALARLRGCSRPGTFPDDQLRWALARADATAAIELLDRCMAALDLEQIEADGARFRTPGADAVADRLLGILRHQGFQFGLGSLVLEKCSPRAAKYTRKLRPGIGCAHVDDPHRLDSRPGRLDTEEARGLAALDAAPEFFLRGEQEVLVERIRRDRDLDPLAAAGDDREHRQLGIGDPHVVLQLRHVFFGRPFFGERPRQHELGLENCPGGLDHAVEGRRHPAHHRMLHPALDVGKDLPGIALVPAPIEGLGHHPELDDEIAGKVLRLDLAAFFPPQAEQGGLVIAHDDSGVGAADEGAPVRQSR